VTLTAARPTAEAPRAARGFLARAFGITALLSAAGSLLGLLRDLLLARLYGADQGTDAFLVSWTVPETAAPLLIEDAMAFLMVPAFSLALAARDEPATGPGPGPATVPGRRRPDGSSLVQLRDPVRELVAATLPPLALLLAGLSAATALGAPLLVGLLAPGLPDPALAVVCTRLTALTVLPFGLTGYLSAGLRAHHRFIGPGAVYIVYNTGILAVMMLLHGSLGVRAAAAGVALGSVLMTALLLPLFSRRCCALTSPRRGPARQALAISPLALLPVALFTLTRQAQVFVERFLASSLAPGTISHLNYAEKIAQMAMTLGMMVCTVTFPLVARALAEGDTEAARRRVEQDLELVGAVVLAGTAVLVACAPRIVQLLFQRGAFTATDTADTAAVMRIYSLGLLGQAMVGTLVRPFFSVRPAVNLGGPALRRDRSDWYPIAAMGLGLLVTAVIGAASAHRFGALGLAAANATGITLTAALLLGALRARGVPVRVPAVLLTQLRLLLAAAVATAASGWASGWAGGQAGGRSGGDPLLAVALGATAGLAVFVAALALLTGRLPTRAPAVAGRASEGERV
jgi:putative peptidoglycan lipid II flippase